ncbi:copper resistance protein B [Parerythrobacter aurantius]|uniref:copper resistance protein B n=1 Tax=Parerythrobacter aurantius TaxID=3127706 RepID=UPI00324DF380
MRALIGLSLLALATPLASQVQDPHAGHDMPAPAPAPAPKPTTAPSAGHDHHPPASEPMDHGAMDHGAMDHGAMDHGQMDHGSGAHGEAPTADEPPPARALEGPRHAADAIWGEEAMAPARKQLGREHGTMITGVVLIERLEARVKDGADGFVWDGQAWWGGDLDKLFVKTEGEGELDGPVEDAEVQLLYSRAIGPFFDLQAGARLDLEPETRSHLVLGVQGLAPYMFHVDAAAFLSDRGDLTARLEGEYDQKITQALILQPRSELELAAQDIPERAIGAGFTKLEAGLRLRYEIVREFAPYLGVEYEAKLGETADIARAQGEDPDGFAMVLGLRAWF